MGIVITKFWDCTVLGLCWKKTEGEVKVSGRYLHRLHLFFRLHLSHGKVCPVRMQPATNDPTLISRTDCVVRGGVKCITCTAMKATSHQVTAMLATSKNVLFPGHNHLLTTGTGDPEPGTGLGNRTFSEVASMMVT